jgi:hypothetical protein
MTKVVHCKHSPCDVYIGRPSKWGNPFRIGADGTRDEVIAQYEDWIKTQPELLASLHELKDKTLGCWCWPWPCHGDVLAKLADAPPTKS